MKKRIEDFLKIYPAKILIEQSVSNGTSFNAPDFEKYMDTQRGFDINEIEVLEYKTYYDIIFWDINEYPIQSLAVPK